MNLICRSLICFFTLFLSTKVLFSQEIAIGGNGLIGIINSNSTDGIGLGINGEYQTAKLPLAFCLSGNIYNASFDNSTFLASYTHTLKTIECDILYIPFKAVANPYVGLGIGYNDVIIDQSGNILTLGNKFVKSRDPKNSLSYNIIVGFRTEKTVSFFSELLYRIINISYKVDLWDQNTSQTIDEKVDLANVLLNVGIRITL